MTFVLAGRPDVLERVETFFNTLGLTPLNQATIPRTDHPDLEFLFLPGQGFFSDRADCRVLVVFGEDSRVNRHARQAHLVLTDTHDSPRRLSSRFKLVDFSLALDGRALSERQIS